jgi:pimeloyl-ACP methyl ester carboxylesterase
MCGIRPDGPTGRGLPQPWRNSSRMPNGPDLVRALVVSPPVPGIGERIRAAQAQQEFWYQSFHRLELADQLIDGDREAVRTYLRHFWSAWSGPDFELDPEHLDHLVSVYADPGAFTASIGWYRAGAGTVVSSLAERPPRPQDRTTAPTTVLWPEFDPLFPRAWSDRLDDYFANARLRFVDGAGHFTPLECADAFAAALNAAGRAGCST